MSDTPRTDAKTKELVDRGCDITYPALQYAKLAEQLERELERFKGASGNYVVDREIEPRAMSLLACPFCGSGDQFVERATLCDAYVMCNNCGARGPTACQESDDEETPGEMEARAAWNRRA